MAIIIRSVALIVVATAMVACSAKPSDTSASAGTGSAPAATAGGPAAAGGDYHGVPIYPGMAELTKNDVPGGPTGTLHSGNFRSSDSQEKILAFYRAALTKQFGAVADMPGAGDGFVRIASGDNVSKQVTILIHPGDSGDQIVGIQVASKD